MVLDGLRGYLQLANGLTDVTRERALAAARSLVTQGEASVGAVVPAPVKAQVASVTDDLIATSRTNRALLTNLVRGEVDKSVARLGLVSRKELDAERKRADRLEARLRDLETKVPAAAKKSASRSTKTSTAKKATKKATAPTAESPAAGASAATTETQADA